MLVFLKKIFSAFYSKHFLLFILFSGSASIINLGSRILFNLFISYTLSVICAYCCGMLTAFSLNKFFNFKNNDNKVHYEIVNFVIINLIGLLQTLAVSLTLAYIVFPHFGIEKYRYFIAHFIGSATPFFTSFLGHKYITFGKYSFKDIVRKFKEPPKSPEGGLEKSSSISPPSGD